VSLALAASFVVALAPRLVFGEKVENVLLRDAATHPSRTISVIVGKLDASDRSLEQTVVAGGGRIGRVLPIIDGFEARIPARLVPSLGLNFNLRSISLNRKVQMSSASYDDSTVASPYVKSTGISTSAWAAGNYGDGIGVAVLDTGISEMNDFTANGMRVVHGPDLSGENTSVDNYGHGTVMSGIIGGDGYDSAGQAGGAFVGVAPKSWLVAVKVAGRNGSTDVSTVLAGIHWIAAYHDQFNIRVVNISWGTNGTQSYKVDPLDYAVERLWQLGITVVVSAGNSGPNASTVTKPADDPFVITVGAYDDKQNIDPSDDSISSWSSRGPTAADGLAKPDLVAPGRLIIAARSYGSYIEQSFPKALRAPSYVRGSGTSQATAVVSGSAALLIRQRPYLSPAQVKYILTTTANSISTFNAMDQGAGRLNVAAALASTNEQYANATTQPSSGLGYLEGSRGGAHVQVTCPNGVLTTIQGEITVQCQPWNGASWTGGSWTGASWTGGSWTGGSWTGGSWTGGSWTGASWTGGSWTGGSWTGGSWTGGSWTGGSWTAGSWTAGSWTGGSWTGASWTGGSWTGGSWTGGSWTAGSWTGGSWTGGSWTGGSWTSAGYDEFTSAGYDEFMTAFWGNQPPKWKHLPGEVSETGPHASGAQA
jgi:serine protease AprX